MKFLLMNIGCIECGVSSKIVGIFTTEKKAKELAAILEEKNAWRKDGQNRYEVFELPEDNIIDEEYRKFTSI